MKINAEQLSAHLAKTLLPIYIISGDEILLAEEAIDKIKQIAQQNGYIDNRTFDMQDNESWLILNHEMQSRSLFAEKSVYICRLKQTKLPEIGKKFLEQLSKATPSDKLLIITTNKLTADQQKANWLQSLDKIGGMIQVWPIQLKQFPFWIKQRLQQYGYDIETSALQFLADQTEGNLLAAKQSIEKITLLYEKGLLNLSQVMGCIAPSVRYNVFDLANAISEKKTVKIVTILHDLQAEGIELPIVLWAIARECRKLARMELLPELARIDHMIKGIIPGKSWLAIQSVCLALAGKALFNEKNA